MQNGFMTVRTAPIAPQILAMFISLSSNSCGLSPHCKAAWMLLYGFESWMDRSYYHMSVVKVSKC